VSPSSVPQIILLGDSAVGKSKLVERYLMDNYHPRQRSTYALTLYRHDVDVEELGDDAGAAGASAAGADGGEGGGAAAEGAPKRKRRVAVDFWDTAGQERFASMHASYYYRCVFLRCLPARVRARAHAWGSDACHLSLRACLCRLQSRPPAALAAPMRAC
jgi:GTPase SAR1 family protein